MTVRPMTVVLPWRNLQKAYKIRKGEKVRLETRVETFVKEE